MTERIETTEQIIDSITEDFFKGMREGHKPLTLEKIDRAPSMFGPEENEYTIVDEKGIPSKFWFKKSEIIKALKNNDNNTKEAFKDLIKHRKETIKEAKVKEEIAKLKDIEERRLIREEAEKRVYGKVVDNKRLTISEKDKEVIFNKFDNKCAVCNKTEGLHIHHKDYNPSNNRLPINSPSLVNLLNINF